MDKGRPVVVDGMVDEWGAIRAWRKNEFVEKYGNKNVTLLRSGDGGHQGDEAQSPTVRAYVEFVEQSAHKNGLNDMKNEAGLASRRMAGHVIGDKGRFPNFFSRNFPLGRGILDDYEEVGIFDTDELGGNHNWGTEKRRGKR